MEVTLKVAFWRSEKTASCVSILVLMEVTLKVDGSGDGTRTRGLFQSLF